MPRIVSSWIWAGLRQGTDDPFASDLANAKSRSATAEGPSAASIRTQHHRQSHGESRHPCSRGGANLPKVRDAGLAVRISCTRRDTARSAVLRACQGHSRSWSHFRFLTSTVFLRNALIANDSHAGLGTTFGVGCGGWRLRPGRISSPCRARSARTGGPRRPARAWRRCPSPPRSGARE